MDETTLTFTSADGIDVHTWRWAPDGAARAAVQVQHGLAEHGGRYRRFAEALTARGYLVYAPDSRGAGRTAAGRHGDWGPDGWPGWVDDVRRLGQRIRTDNPGLALGLFGHSMGSFATQQLLLEHSGDVDAVVLCGSTEVGWLVGVLDSDAPADLSVYNAPFDHRTGFEWLSRDTAEVDAYVADPACGWAAPPLPGIATLAAAADPACIADVRDDLPLLIVSGDADPLAQGGEATEVLARRYREAGLTDVQVHRYPGARHELLNETNRDEVTAEVLEFLDRALG